MFVLFKIFKKDKLITMSAQQTKLINHWKSKGYFVINLVKITPSGLPDLLALKPKEVIFVESKEKWDKLKNTFICHWCVEIIHIESGKYQYWIFDYYGNRINVLKNNPIT